MGQIALSIGAIALVMFLGWLGRRLGLLPAATVSVLTRFVYWLAAPAMLFSAMSTSDLQAVVGLPLLVAAASGLGSVLFFVLVSGALFRPPVPELAIGAMSASLNNAAYIGIPVAVIVLGSAAHAIPILIFQLGFLSPAFFVIADLIGTKARPSVGRVLRGTLTNPMVIAAAAGALAAWFALPIPAVLAVPLGWLGSSAAPLVLIAFGASMYRQSLGFRSQEGRLAIVATATKAWVQPGLAFVVGYAAGMRGPTLMAVTVMAALPTAQNAFVAASRARAGADVARATVLATNLVSLPTIMLIAWLFHMLGTS